MAIAVAVLVCSVLGSFVYIQISARKRREGK